MTRTDATFAAATVRQFERATFRWWFAEVVREDVANDNVDAATWAASWSSWAASRAGDAGFAEQVDRVRFSVAAVRQANRPSAV